MSRFSHYKDNELSPKGGKNLPKLVFSAAYPYLCNAKHLIRLDFSRYIEDPSQLDRNTLEELKQLIADYPFFQLARLLYVANLFVLRDQSFGPELRKASALVPDRTALFQLVEAKNYEIEVQHPADDEQAIMTESDDRTITLIDSFLSTQPAQTDEKDKAAEPHHVPTWTEVTSDYASFLEMQEDAPVDPADEGTASLQLNGASLIDNFINETRGQQRYVIADGSEDEPVGLTPQETDADDSLYNENIVNLLIKQEQYEQALEILHKICLNNPEKSATFAPQMQLLQVIVGANKINKK